MTSRPSTQRTDRRPDRTVAAVAIAVSTVLIGSSSRYGPHRDELYFIAAGHHPQWGYPDQPPLTPMLAAAADAVVPGSLLALRLVSALAIGAVVLITADLCRALGGGAGARLLAAVVTASGSGLLAVGHLLSTATLDLLFWTLLIRLVVAALQHDRPQLWLPAGLVLGVGLENKSLIGFLAAGLLLGVLLTRGLRHHLRSPWLWSGGALAMVTWAPNLSWQASHGWPQLALSRDIRDEFRTPGGIAMLIGFQLLLLSPVAAPLLIGGIRGGLRRPTWTFFQPVAIAYLALVAAFVVLGGKHYYLLGLLPALAAAGAVLLAERVSEPALRRATVVAFVVALFPVPALLPVLPAATLDATFYPALDADSVETIGWPRVVATVTRVVMALPAAQRSDAVIVTSNYGEAGALLWYGAPAPVFSGHNGFGDWGPPRTAGPIVYVGPTTPDPAAVRACRRAATLRTGVDNEENGHGVWVCAGPAGSWAQAWRPLRHLDA